MKSSDRIAWKALVLLSLILGCRAVAAPSFEPYNVVWTSPSKDAAGSMPLGNGEVGINLWVERNGDLLFYISRSDSFSEQGRLLKVGQVRVALFPNPFVDNRPFRQELKLAEGLCEITAGEGKDKVNLRVWVDSKKPVVYCEGESENSLSVKVTAECWRTERQVIAKGEEQISAWTMKGAPYDLFESADVFPANTGDAVVWYHRNEESAVPATLKVQSLEADAALVKDPLLHRTFGGWMKAAGFKAEGHSIATAAPVKSFEVQVAVPCAQTASAQVWLDEAKKVAESAPSAKNSQRQSAAWWREFWDRSWVNVDGDQGWSVPENSFPLRIGYDSNGKNKFPGTLGRVGAYGRALSKDEIARLAVTSYDLETPVKQGLQASAVGGPREFVSTPLDFKQGFTLEAWIKPDELPPGRIFDKLTAGQSDGFLFDTYPGNTLRLIVGSQTFSAPASCLKPGQWHHAAATLDAVTGALRIYLDGEVLVDRPGDNLSPVTRAYVLQHYMQACGGRGNYPIKFNGGIFTVEPKAMGKPYNPDWRAWGDCHWWQNVRHMYYPMLAGGDFEMMTPLFKMYEAARPLCEARALQYYGAQGCYFPETMTVWGTYANGDYGWDRTGREPKDVMCGYWAKSWTQGPELVALLLDRWDYTGDEAFLKKQVLPMAESVLKYFDTRFKKGTDGKIILDPTQSVETYWEAVNDMPAVAGLNEISTRLCDLPERLVPSAQRQFFLKMKAAAPPVPMEKADGSDQMRLAPAQTYVHKRSNCENPELYAVWPFHLYGVGKPDLEPARLAYAQRGNHLDVGWGFDGNCAALLGLTDEAARILKVKCANSNPAYRWPATWGPNFDWLPDQNHGGNLLETAQLMLLQPQGRKILLLPSWPKNWDVEFKLHAPMQTVVECVYRKGELQKLHVTPASRTADVIDMTKGR